MADTTKWALCVITLALPGCADDGQGFLLDSLCRGAIFNPQSGGVASTCRLSGDATFTSGITSDAIAVTLGPAGGQIDIALAAIPAVHQSTWSLDALVASRRAEGSVLGRPQINWGSCGVTCPGPIEGVELDLTEDLRWAVLVDTRPGTATSFTGAGSSTIPADAVITLRGSDIDILELRTPGFAEAPAPSF